ncbi:MAG TPA: FxLYD domain-containing protein [Vicinamibacterales bacterium]
MLIITFTACFVAITMTVLAWRVLREDRRRMDARVAALAAELNDGSATHPSEVALTEAPHVPVDHLFANADTEGDRPRPRLAAIVGGGALVVGTVGALLLFVTSGARPAASTGAKAKPAAAAAATAPASSPLELVALGHEREDDRLTVRGIVRNPAGGHAITDVTAVVMLFNQQGGFVTSGRAAIQGALAPGGEAPFTVTVPGAADVGRYRVSFRTTEGVLPHIDRRS